MKFECTQVLHQNKRSSVESRCGQQLRNIHDALVTEYTMCDICSMHFPDNTFYTPSTTGRNILEPKSKSAVLRRDQGDGKICSRERREQCSTAMMTTTGTEVATAIRRTMSIIIWLQWQRQGDEVKFYEDTIFILNQLVQEFCVGWLLWFVRFLRKSVRNSWKGVKELARRAPKADNPYREYRTTHTYNLKLWLTWFAIREDNCVYFVTGKYYT